MEAVIMPMCITSNYDGEWKKKQQAMGDVLNKNES